MRLVSYIVGMVLIVLGGVWCLQGLNLLPGSFMTGHIRWTVYGAILAILGLALMLWTGRRRR